MKTLRGFSLVELMIGIAIFGLLLALAAPSFATWIANAKIRTTAESVQTGLQIARTEAVRRNTVVRFQLTDNSGALSTSGPNWVVSMGDSTTLQIIQVRNGAEGSDSRTAVLAGLSSFAFNGMGRPTTAPTAIDISNSTTGLSCLPSGTVRCLRIDVTPAGRIRMCDPALPSGDTQGC